MAKNAPNELKLGPDMYFYEFYQILEDFWKIFKIGRFLAEKRSFSACFASRSEKKIPWKMYQRPQKCFN